MDESTPEKAPQPVYMLAAHPNLRESRVNRRLLEAAAGLPGVDINDLFATSPDYDIDVASEQLRAEAAQLIVLLHPIQFYSMPALMKLWLDEVLAVGWAYGGRNALRGKDLWLVASLGGTEASYHPQGYNRYFFDAFIPPYEQTAALCGLRFLPPMLLYGAHQASDDEIASHASMFRQRLVSYPDWPEMDDVLSCPECVVPATDLPKAPSSAAGPSVGAQ